MVVVDDDDNDDDGSNNNNSTKSGKKGTNDTSNKNTSVCQIWHLEEVRFI